MHQVLAAEKTGVWFDRWFVKLVSATESRVREQADRALTGTVSPAPRPGRDRYPRRDADALAAANRLRKLIGRVTGSHCPPDVRR